MIRTVVLVNKLSDVVNVTKLSYHINHQMLLHIVNPSSPGDNLKENEHHNKQPIRVLRILDGRFDGAV